MKRLAALSLLVLVACCGGPSPSPPGPTPVPVPVTQPVTSPLWHMTPGTWTEFDQYTMTGTFIDGHIQINTLSQPYHRIRMTNLAYGTAGRVARIYGEAGVQVDTVPVDLAGVLVEGRRDRLLGEVANSGASDITPPEAILTIDPVAGEVISTTSTVTYSGGTIPYNTKYWTFAVNFPNADGFLNATVTGLVEQPEKPDFTAYNHIFADGELAEIWYGTVDINDSKTINGYLARRVATGVNTP